jgi:hypothetical protein
MTAQGQRARSGDPDLAEIVDAWTVLPGATKAALLAIVRAAKK